MCRLRRNSCLPRLRGKVARSAGWGASYLCPSMARNNGLMTLFRPFGPPSPADGGRQGTITCDSPALARKRRKTEAVTSPAQIQGQRVLRIVDPPRFGGQSAGMADLEEPGPAAGLGLVGVDGHAVVAAAAGMGDVIGAAADRAAVHVSTMSKVSGAWTPMVGCRIRPAATRGSARRRRIRPRAGGMQRQAPAVAGDDVARSSAVDLDLEAFDRQST